MNIAVQPQTIKLARQLVVCRRIHFVARQHDRFVALANEPCNVLVQVSKSRLAVDHEQDQRRFLNADLHLRANRCLERIVTFGNPATRIDYGELAPRPLRSAVLAVTRRTRRGIDDGVLRLGQPIEHG